MTQSTLLPLAEIVRRIGMDRSALNRYLELPENRALLQGADTHPQYPLEALPLFFKLAEEHAAGGVTPKTLAARHRALSENQSAESEYRSPETEQSTGQALTITPAALERGAEALADALVVAAQRRGLIIGEDRLLGREEAAKMLNCRPGGVRHRVPPVEKGSYRLSDIQAYIRSLCAKSEHRKPESAQTT